MSRGRGRRHASAHGGGEGGHDGPDERWAVSYSDMVTVLMCLFIVLFAMSSVDQGKYDELRSSLATGFGVDKSEHEDLAEGVIVPEELLDEEGEGFMELMAEAQKEHETLSALRTQLEAALNAAGLGGAATFTIDERGLTIGLVSTETFFMTNSTRLSGTAQGVLAAIGSVLAADAHELSVEGHADYRAPVAPFETNWELSSGRATSVLRDLVEARGVQAERVKSVGFGSTKPLAAGTTDAELAQNRRVDVVVLSAAPQEVRELLPQIEKNLTAH